MSIKNPKQSGIVRYLWLIPAALLIGNAISVGLQIRDGEQLNQINDVAFNFNGLIFAAVGTLIIARKPRQIIGWLLMGYPLLVILENLGLNYLLAHPPSPDPEVFTLLIAWFNGWIWWLLIGPLLLILQLFPTGKPNSSRWRWPGRILLWTFIYFIVFGTLGTDMDVETLGFVYPNPIKVIPEGILDVGFILFAALLITTVVLSVISVFVRYRQGGQTERAQLKWLLFAATIFLISYIPGFFSELWNESNSIPGILFNLSLFFIPVAIGIAILQYHLWDINVVINRTLVYGLLTALIAAIWAGSLTVIDQVISNLVGDQSKAASTVLSTLLAASIIQPARAKIESRINRRFFPEKRQLETGFIEIEPEFWGYVEIEQVAQLAVDRVCGIMQAPKGAFMVRNEEGMYTTVASYGIESSEVQPWKPDANDLKELQRERAAVWEESLHFSGYIPLFIPRVGPNEVIGLLALSERIQRRGYSGDDLKALVQLGGKLGKVLYAHELKEVE
jgi:hypothetical protein